MHEIDLQKLVGSADLSALPESLAIFIQALLEGRVAEYALVAVMEDGSVMSGFPVEADSRDVYKMLGAIECMKRDYMRMHVESRVEYVGRQDD